MFLTPRQLLYYPKNAYALFEKLNSKHTNKSARFYNNCVLDNISGSYSRSSTLMSLFARSTL